MTARKWLADRPAFARLVVKVNAESEAPYYCFQNVNGKTMDQGLTNPDGPIGIAVIDSVQQVHFLRIHSASYDLVHQGAKLFLTDCSPISSVCSCAHKHMFQDQNMDGCSVDWCIALRAPAQNIHCYRSSERKMFDTECPQQ